MKQNRQFLAWVAMSVLVSPALATPPPAVMVGSLSMGGSKYNVLADETYNTFSYTCTVFKPALVESVITPTSFLRREQMKPSRLNNKSVIDQMIKEGALPRDSWTLVWITPGNGSDPGAGALYAVNPKRPRVPVTAPYLEVTLQPTQAVAAETTSGKIPSDPRVYKFNATGYVPGTVQLSYITSTGLFSFRTDYRNLVVSGNSVATYASTLSGSTAGSFQTP